jgi:hypothetical protein
MRSNAVTESELSLALIREEDECGRSCSESGSNQAIRVAVCGPIRAAPCEEWVCEVERGYNTDRWPGLVAPRDPLAPRCGVADLQSRNPNEILAVFATKRAQPVFPFNTVLACHGDGFRFRG